MENKKRQIIIETDGNMINLVKSEVASLLEFTAIINQLSDFVAKQSQIARDQAIKSMEKEPKDEEKVVEPAK